MAPDRPQHLLQLLLLVLEVLLDALPLRSGMKLEALEAGLDRVHALPHGQLQLVPAFFSSARALRGILEFAIG